MPGEISSPRLPMQNISSSTSVSVGPYDCMTANVPFESYAGSVTSAIALGRPAIGLASDSGYMKPSVRVILNGLGAHYNLKGSNKSASCGSNELIVRTIIPWSQHHSSERMLDSMMLN